RTMAEAIGLRLRQLIKDYVAINDSYVGAAQDYKRKMTESFNCLMNYLRDMMVGYESTQVLALLKQMEDAVDMYEEVMRNINIFYDVIVEEEKTVVGFNDEIEELLDQLTGTSTKQFQIISITGMAGLGKTTLARTLYSHELVKYIFDFRAWTCVSQSARPAHVLRLRTEVESWAIFQKKADGQVKTCRIHDLLRDFGIRKAKEENFLINNYRYGSLSSMLCFPLELGKSLQEDGSININTYKFLLVLDLESILISLFPLDVVQMVNLRYLAIRAHDASPHAYISNLVNLQMLIVSSKKNIVVPKTIWNMVNLRHVYIKSGENLMEEPSLLQVTGNNGPDALASFQTLSQVSPRSCHNIFSRTPNLRKLGFCGPLMSSLGDLEFPNLGSLEKLQKLKLLNTCPYPEATRSCNPILFPENLRNLTLSNTGMDWEEMWSFSLLPNLEILKLKFQACVGEIWETGDAEFQKLKVLKLHDLDIKQWVCSRDNFPRLQRLVVHRCLKLDSVPTDIGRIFTLEVIEWKFRKNKRMKEVLALLEKKMEGLVASEAWYMHIGDWHAFVTRQ
ncbi:hypothetical protein M8C21_005925, partial [Ambrosia artemisiifolia]